MHMRIQSHVAQIPPSKCDGYTCMLQEKKKKERKKETTTTTTITKKHLYSVVKKKKKATSNDRARKVAMLSMNILTAYKQK